MLPADRKIFRLVRRLLWEAEVQRRLPAALRRRKERAVAEDGAEDGGLEEEAEAEGAQWLGMWPILDPSALGARRADSDAPRWQAVVAASSHGASGGEGTRRRPSAVGLRFMLRSGVPLDGLFGLACCPLCGQAGVPLDVRHVLSGECDAGASAEERAHAAALLRELEAKLPLGADAHEGAGRHDAALTRELRLAARVLGAEGGAVPRGETSDEEWWMAARLASGMPPGLGPGARAAILSEAEAKERAAPEKKKVGMAAAREAAMSGARGDVMGVMDKLAYHLAQVVGSWCGRLAGQEEERADRGAARGPGPHGAPSPMPTAPRRAPVRTRADTPEHVPARLSAEEAASARCERQGRREAGKQEAAEREAEAVGARPLRLTTQVGLVALRRLRDRGWTAARAEAEANEAATVDVAAPATATGAGSEGDAGERIGDGATPAAGLGRSPSHRGLRRRACTRRRRTALDPRRPGGRRRRRRGGCGSARRRRCTSSGGLM